MGVGTCVVSCIETAKSTKMHVLSKDPELFSKWCQAIGRSILYDKRKNYRVCDKHFSDDDKFPVFNNKTNIKWGSIPRLYCPDIHEISYVDVGKVSLPVHVLASAIVNTMTEALLPVEGSLNNMSQEIVVGSGNGNSLESARTPPTCKG